MNRTPPQENDPVLVGGIVPLTTVDFPGRLAFVVFTKGCPWRCPYCHNVPLRRMRSAGNIPWNSVLRQLEERRGFLDGVVFSGGEPTCHARLPEAVRQVRQLGFEIGLHTAGIFPHRLAAILPDLHWVGLDIKGPLDYRYDWITGRRGSNRHIVESLKLVMQSGVEFQLRTTVSPEITTSRDLEDMRCHLRKLGAPEPVIQPVRPPPKLTYPS